MVIDKVGLAGGVGATLAQEAGRQPFSQVLQGVKSAGEPSPIPVATEGSASAAAVARVDAAQSVEEPQAARLLDGVMGAQQRLDHILALAESGRTFTPAQLLTLQAQVYSASQEIDLASKVVDKATSGLKQVLQTQV